MEQLQSLTEQTEELAPLIIDYGLNLLGAIVILILGYIVAGWAAKKVRNRSARLDETLVPVLAQTVRVTILLITLLAVLAQFGVQTASIIAILGAAGLAIGLALQGTLSNIAAGMMLLTLRPFKIGDVVNIGGTFGVIDEIGLFIIQMHSFDNIGIVIPNSTVWNSEIQNLSKFDTRRVDLEFGISYSDDMDKAIRLIEEVLNEDERVLDDPEPLIAISELGDSFVGIRVRPWTEAANVWPLHYHLLKRVKEIFDENDVSIPFPQRDVHLFQNNKN